MFCSWEGALCQLIELLARALPMVTLILQIYSITLPGRTTKYTQICFSFLEFWKSFRTEQKGAKRTEYSLMSRIQYILFIYILFKISMFDFYTLQNCMSCTYAPITVLCYSAGDNWVHYNAIFHCFTKP